MLQNFISRKTEQRVRDRVAKPWRRQTSAYSEDVVEAIPDQHIAHVDYIRSTKRALEPSKTHLPYLVVEDEYITSPERMASALKKTWEPIWEGKAIPVSYTHLRAHET